MAKKTIKFTLSETTKDMLDHADRLIVASEVSPFNTKTQFYDYIMRKGLNAFIVENKDE